VVGHRSSLSNARRRNGGKKSLFVKQIVVVLRDALKVRKVGGFLALMCRESSQVRSVEWKEGM
jgi:hypothetical protein